MSQSPSSAIVPHPTSHAAVQPAPQTQRTTLAELLGNVVGVPTTAQAVEYQDRIVLGRLGIAGALFTALRVKHPPTAQHCLRVALHCSAVGKQLGLPAIHLDNLEIAALLHDVGKIGVPDAVLTKPNALKPHEAEVMARHRVHSLDILRGLTDNDEILQIIRCSCLRYDGEQQRPPVIARQSIPLGARILAIADAYDAMTTDCVYRKAFTRERAIAELFAHAGTQFDPELVQYFSYQSSQIEAQLLQIVSQRWASMKPDAANQLWVGGETFLRGTDGAEVVFQQRLLDAMHDGVVFVDVCGQIVLWNQGLENLSEVKRESVLNTTWSSSILGLRDVEGNLLKGAACPVSYAIESGGQVVRRCTITRMRGNSLAVDIHVIPIIDGEHRCMGVAMTLRDVSSELSLEETVQDLHEKATTDPLTGVNNRAEFDRSHEELIQSCLTTGEPLSIVICDIDHFKKVNDIHGHQAGDAVLIEFGTVLSRFSRDNDVVARYGGEEFVMLCPGCDMASAAKMAEQIRSHLCDSPQDALGRQCITASFGVTELQPGDTPETMLRRADRGLYQAKDAGRNTVIQIGAGMASGKESTSSQSWLGWLQRRPSGCLLEKQLVATSPMNVLVEKIKGFIADHDAEVVKIEENFVVLSLDSNSEFQRRQSDRPQALVLELELHEHEENRKTQTTIRVTIRPKRSRDRRTQGAEIAQRLLASLRSYLIAQECSAKE